jgi:hypothetical protein
MVDSARPAIWTLKELREHRARLDRMGSDLQRTTAKIAWAQVAVMDSQDLIERLDKGFPSTDRQ